MKKKILLTGSNGLLGQKIVHALRGKPETALTATSKGENRISALEGYEYRPLDVTSSKEIKKIFEDVKPDVLINTAAMTNVDACEKDKDGCRKLNVEAVEHLARECDRCETHLIHLSTDFVFDGKNPPGPYGEDAVPHPQSFYAQSKLDSERIVEKMKAPWTIVRTILVYGLVENMSRSNFALWAVDSLSEQKKIRVVSDQFRAPTLAEDLAAGCIAAAAKNATGIYHVSGKDLMSVYELVQTVAEVFQLNASLIEEIKDSATLGQAAERPKKTGFILDKARKDLGYEPRSFREGLEVLKKQLQKIRA